MSSTSLSPKLTRSAERPSVLIVSPTLAEANTGNWHTAARWARMLKDDCRIAIQREWAGEPHDLLIALHARKSASSVQAWSAAHPDRPLVVVLTGTDLYRDIRCDAVAARSLELATHLVGLQDEAPNELAPALSAKCRVIYQSAPRLAPIDPPGRVLRVVSVGHLRDEKDPETFMRAAMRLQTRPSIHFEQIGDALDPLLARAAHGTARTAPHYHWRGGLPRPATRQRIRRAHLLVNTSRMEGGAQVILEAAQSGTAVLASRVPGNVGMLGARHAGWFELGDDAHLARLIERAADDAVFLARLRRQTLARADRFEPAREQAHLKKLLKDALHRSPP